MAERGVYNVTREERRNGREVETGQVEWVDIELLKPSEFNPISRTEGDRRLTAIRKLMMRDGFWPHMPILVTEDYEIGAGHRRYAVARQLGLNEVPVMVVRGKTASQIWADDENGKLSITSSQTLWAYEHGLDVIPDKHKFQIEKIREMGGEELIEFLVKNGQSHAIVKTANSVARYCGVPLKDKQFRNSLVHWLVSHKMQRHVRTAMTMDIPPAVIIQAVHRNVPLVFGIAR